MRAATTTPAGPVGALVLLFPTSVGLPHHYVGSTPAPGVTRLAQCSHMLRPAWLADSPREPFLEVLQRIRYLLHRPECFRPEGQFFGLDFHQSSRCSFQDTHNGATYSGKGLEVVCARLGIRLIHARPYDPQARGKMERFWRTLRAACLDFVGSCRSLHEVQVRLIAFLERHYHRAAHGGLRGGAAPREVFRATPAPQSLLSEDTLEAAFTVRGNRKVSRDGVISVGGVLWEVEASFLANRKVTVARSLLSKKRPPWIEADDTTYSVRLLDPVANGKCTRHPKKPKLIDAIPFDPATALLHELTGRNPDGKENAR